MSGVLEVVIITFFGLCVPFFVTLHPLTASRYSYRGPLGKVKIDGREYSFPGLTCVWFGDLIQFLT
jgi:hypothetical protein